MFGDNKTVVDSSTIPEAKIYNKRHVMLSFHRVQEAIACGIISFVHVDGDNNPIDMISKHWGYQKV